MVYVGEEDEMTIEAIITDVELRGEGRASNAIREVLELADQLGKTLYLEPVQLDTDSGMSVDDLIAFYKSVGFLSLDKECKVMVRKPQ